MHGPDLILWRARVHDSGKFYCEGVRDTVVGQTHTLQSLPAEIFVDGKINITMTLLDLHPVTLQCSSPV